MVSTRSKTSTTTMASTSGTKRTKMTPEQRREANRLAQQKRRSNPETKNTDYLHDFISYHTKSDKPKPVHAGVFDRLAEHIPGITGKDIYDQINAIRASKGFPPISGRAKQLMDLKEIAAKAKAKPAATRARSPTPARDIEDTRSDVGSIDPGDDGDEIDSSTPTITGPLTLWKLFNPESKDGVRFYETPNHRTGISSKSQPTTYLTTANQIKQAKLFEHALKFIFNGEIDFKADIVEMFKKKFGNKRISLKDDIFFRFITKMPSMKSSTKLYSKGSYNKLISPWSKVARIFKKFRDLFSDEPEKLVTWVKEQYTKNDDIDTAALPKEKTYPAMVKALNAEIAQAKKLKSFKKEDTTAFMDNLIIMSLKLTNPPLRSDENEIVMLDTEKEWASEMKENSTGKYYVRSTGKMYIGATAKNKSVRMFTVSDHTRDTISWVEKKTGRRDYLISPHSDFTGYIRALTGYGVTDFRHAWTTYVAGNPNLSAQDAARVATRMDHNLNTAAENYAFSGTKFVQAPKINSIEYNGVTIEKLVKALAKSK